MTIQEFITKYKVGFSCKWADKNPNMEPSPYMTRHFRCVIKMSCPNDWRQFGRSSKTRQMVVYFSQGSAHTSEPTCADVLDCLASDVTGIESQSFEDWCSDLGYDTDSRTAERTYNAVYKQLNSLTRLFGNDKLQELIDCERL